MCRPVLLLVCNYKPQALLWAYQIFKDDLFFYSCIYYPEAFVNSSYSTPNLYIYIIYIICAISSSILSVFYVYLPLAFSLSVIEHQLYLPLCLFNQYHLSRFHSLSPVAKSVSKELQISWQNSCWCSEIIGVLSTVTKTCTSGSASEHEYTCQVHNSSFSVETLLPCC